MKSAKAVVLLSILLLSVSCGKREGALSKLSLRKAPAISDLAFPIDQGFSEYISGYTSGTVRANSVIEIRFTPEFAAMANRKRPSGLITFRPAIKGRTEWIDETTLVFRPSRLLEPGMTWTGVLSLHRIADVKERFRNFPLRIQTVKKDFHVITGHLETTVADENRYVLNGELIASDYLPSAEAEKLVEARLGRNKLNIVWDHSDILSHRFRVTDIRRTAKDQVLTLSWDGAPSGVRRKGSASVGIPSTDKFTVLNLVKYPGESQRMDIVFSDPVDASQEREGLIWIDPATPLTISSNLNIVSIFPGTGLRGVVTVNVEPSLKNSRGVTLPSRFSGQLDFTSVPPSIALTGNGIIVPASQNLIFPFKAANLKSVDLKIIRIFENNLPYFLQEQDINTGWGMKRFGRPVYSGKVDLITGSSMLIPDTWNLYSIDLSDYITVEPGVLYRVELRMRRSYSLFQCSGSPPDSRYEELLNESEARNRDYWDDPDNYYDDVDDLVYYSMGFDWRDRDDPCKDAYYSPDKKASRNIIASNLGIMAKRGDDNRLVVTVNDIITAMPVNEAAIKVFDYQMQLVASGNTGKEGSVALICERKPFLLVAEKDQDRNYLKVNDGSSLSLSSFDVSGTVPEEGLKTFIHGERDVWRPGDSVFLSVFIRDMKNELPENHPVQFELINPLEQRTDYQVQPYAKGKILVFRTSTKAGDITGNYRAVIRIGGATFTKRVRVETIKPNRLKINLSFPSEILGGKAGASRGSIDVKWLTGLTAGNQRSTVEYLLKHTRTEFPGYGQYNFDDPATEFYAETVKTFEGSTDDNGKASFTFDPALPFNAPGMLNAVFTAKVAERGGDESIVQTAFKYSPYSLYAGISIPALKGKERMLFTDRDIDVKVVTVDENGLPASTTAELTVYRISYRWWWESDQENLAYYISSRLYKPSIQQKITTKGGEGSFTFRVDRNEWGRYLIRVSTPGGHSTGRIVLIDWPWEYGIKESGGGATQLAVSTDRDKYNPGDDVRISFPSPEKSMAIITLENSTGIVEEKRVATNPGSTEVIFKASSAMAPNVYAYVTLIQPHAQTINDMPIRLYGIVPVMVEDPGSHLSPVIKMADELRSQKPFEITVTEKDRKPMTYTLAVVDEGLLDITAFRTPDPWNYFYAREALGVRTWDLYDLVLGAFGGTLQRIFAVGGDEAVIDRSLGKAQRFIPAVRFLGPFELGAGKTGTHTVSLPQYTGSVRVMVVAGNERAFGSAEKSVPVRDPLMVLATAPRVISPGEKAHLPVSVFIQKDNISAVSLRAESNSLLSFEQSSLNLQAQGQGEYDAGFIFTAGEKTGRAVIKVSAAGGGETALHEIELDVRSPNPPETRSELRIIKPGEKWESLFSTFGMEGSNSAIAEVSALPSINLKKRIDYLINYPHGCTEQIVSAVFPQLWISRFSGNSSEIAGEASGNIREAIRKIAGRQMSDGGLAMWPGAYQPDNWVTSYTGHFMIEAERMGYLLPTGFKRNWILYQRNRALGWRYDSQFRQSANDQAYRLLTLALAGEPERGAMNRLRETAEIPQLSRWLLAAAYAVSGRPEVAETLLDMRNTSTEPAFHDYYYGSQVRDQAIILYTLTLLKKSDEALPLLRNICDQIGPGSWHSTQTLAWGLFSYMKFAELFPGEAKDKISINLTINGQRSEETIMPDQQLSKSLPVITGENSFGIINNSSVPLYVNIVRKGIPAMADPVSEEKGLAMAVSYVDMNLRPVNQKELKQGTDFMMVTRVTNTSFSRVDNIALVQMVPSGWEIQNTRLFEAAYGIKENPYDYRDFRDDRVATYFSLNRGETKTFVMVLSAAYRGDFYQPSIWCEAMYTENCWSRQPGGMVRVTE